MDEGTPHHGQEGSRRERGCCKGIKSSFLGCQQQRGRALSRTCGLLAHHCHHLFFLQTCLIAVGVATEIEEWPLRKRGWCPPASAPMCPLPAPRSAPPPSLPTFPPCPAPRHRPLIPAHREKMTLLRGFTRPEMRTALAKHGLYGTSRLPPSWTRKTTTASTLEL